VRSAYFIVPSALAFSEGGHRRPAFGWAAIAPYRLHRHILFSQRLSPILLLLTSNFHHQPPTFGNVPIKKAFPTMSGRLSSGFIP
jgi:hypothetical protein